MSTFILLIIAMAIVVSLNVLNIVECHNANENKNKCDADDVECHERAKYTKGNFLMFLIITGD
jgi:hypothetical protein